MKPSQVLPMQVKNLGQDGDHWRLLLKMGGLHYLLRHNPKDLTITIFRSTRTGTEGDPITTGHSLPAALDAFARVLAAPPTRLNLSGDIMWVFVAPAFERQCADHMALTLTPQMHTVHDAA